MSKFFRSSRPLLLAATLALLPGIAAAASDDELASLRAKAGRGNAIAVIAVAVVTLLPPL